MEYLCQNDANCPNQDLLAVNGYKLMNLVISSKILATRQKYLMRHLSRI